MKRRKIWLFLGSLLCMPVIWGQQATTPWQHHLIVETEVLMPNATLYDDIAIRQNPMGDSWSSYDQGTVSFSSGGLALGVRWKLQNASSGWGFSAGIRSKGIVNDITGNSSRNANFYYLRYYASDSEGITRFARIEAIDEALFILTVPIEVNYYFWRHEYFDAFVSAGTELGYVIGRDMEITFRDKTMKQYESAVKTVLEHSTNNFYGSAYGTIGAVMGRSRYFIFELCTPGLFFSDKYFKLGTSKTFTSVRFSLQIPLFKSQQP